MNKDDGFYVSRLNHGEEKVNEDSYDYSIITLAGMIILGLIGVAVAFFGVTALVNFIFNIITT